MKLVLRESPELEGTASVVIEADDKGLAEFAESSQANGPKVVRLQRGRLECGATVRETKQGPNTVLIDKYQRLHLKARADEEIEVQPFRPRKATKAKVRVPATWLTPEGKQLVESRLRGRLVSREASVPIYTFVGTVRLVEIVETAPAGIVLIGRKTELKFEALEEVAEHGEVTYRDIGGLDDEIRRVRELLEYPLRSPDLFSHLGIEAPRGLILYGPPGTGKTLLAKALSNEVGAHFCSIQGPEIVCALVGESEKKLRAIFEEARSNPPSVILIDELDSLAPKRDQMRGELESRLVATLLTLMDGLVALKDVVVLGTTNRVDAIDPALRRPGRFEHEIHIGVPDAKGREMILQIHTSRMPLDDDIALTFLAEKTVGFTGADISSVCREAGYCALRRTYPPESLARGEVYADESLTVGPEDFQTAFGTIQPSALREVMVQVPRDITWNDIGGLDSIKQLIIENIVYGIKKAESFKSVGIRPARGLLLFGPPGTGKTLLAKAVANESGANFIAVRGPELRSKWFGESEEKIRFIFSKAREAAPCILFFDEIDALAPTRGRDVSGLTDSLVNQLLAEMDGIEGADNVFVMAATNMPDLVDPALLRPGRFDYQVEVGLPDPESRLGIFGVHLEGKPLAADVRVDELAGLADGLSGADIAEACRLATLAALRREDFKHSETSVTFEDLQTAISDVQAIQKKVKPRVGFSFDDE